MLTVSCWHFISYVLAMVVFSADTLHTWNMYGFKRQKTPTEFQFQLPAVMLIRVVTLDPSFPPIVLAIIAKCCEKKIRCLCVAACLVT